MIPGTGQHVRCTRLSAITNRGQLALMVFKGRFTVAVWLTFLRRLTRHARRKVFVIVDAHPVHQAAAVDPWVARRQRQIRQFFLPGNSPELNPDEYFNHMMDGVVTTPFSTETLGPVSSAWLG